MREKITTAGEVVGASLIVAGLAILSPAAALTAAGGFFILGSYLAASE